MQIQGTLAVEDVKQTRRGRKPSEDVLAIVGEIGTDEYLQVSFDTEKEAKSVENGVRNFVNKSEDYSGLKVKALSRPDDPTIRLFRLVDAA